MCINNLEQSDWLQLVVGVASIYSACQRLMELVDTHLHVLDEGTLLHCLIIQINVQGPVVQSVVSLTSSLRVISLTVLADSIYNILIFFAEKM